MRGRRPCASSCQRQVFVPWWLSTTRNCSVFRAVVETTTRPKVVGAATPRRYEASFPLESPASRSDSACLPCRTRNPRADSDTVVPRAGTLTRGAELSGEPSSLVRYADASCAFAPRRVASSETAKKAVRRSAAETARRRSEPDRRTATPLAFAKREPGRRSGKLAIVFSIHTRLCVWLQTYESAPAASSVRISPPESCKSCCESPLRGRDRTAQGAPRGRPSPRRLRLD